MIYNLETLTFHDALDLEGKVFKVSIESNLIGKEDVILTDSDTELEGLLTMGVAYHMTTLVAGGYYVTALLNKDKEECIIMLAGELTEDESLQLLIKLAKEDIKQGKVIPSAKFKERLNKRKHYKATCDEVLLNRVNKDKK